MEVAGGCRGIACARRGANVDGRCRCVDVSAGSGGVEVSTTGTTVYYGSVRSGKANLSCVKIVGVGTTA